MGFGATTWQPWKFWSPKWLGDGAAEDMESSKCHLGGVIVRDLSCVVSNYRSVMSLDEYLKQQKVRSLAR